MIIVLNLHSLVNPLIANLHPNEDVVLYQSIGQTNVKGRILPLYSEGEAVELQIQPAGDESLTQQYDANQSTISRKAYLFSDTTAGVIPRSVHRPLARNGDMICRADDTWWLVTSLSEDFSKSGWVSITITEQLKAPDFTACEWYSESDEEEEESEEEAEATGENSLTADAADGETEEEAGSE